MNTLNCLTTLLLFFVLQQKSHTMSFQQLSKKAIIEGTIKNPGIDNVELDTLSTKLDPEGNFRFKVPLQQAEYLILKAGNAKIELYLEPESHIGVEFEEGNLESTIDFKGDNSAINEFLFNQKEVSGRFNDYFNRNANSYLYKLPEQEFVRITDSLKSTFTSPLHELSKKRGRTVEKFVEDYEKDLELSFLAFLADYPILYLKNTGDSTTLSHRSKAKIEAIDLNDPALHKYDGLQGLLKNFLYRETNRELEKEKYSTSDNKRLDAGFAVIKRKFTNPKIFEKVLFDYLHNHIDNLGVKNIEKNISFFNQNVQNQKYREIINQQYKKEVKRRQEHEIRTYKEVDGHKLDAHIFFPDTMQPGKRYPVIAMFHGGSFYEGKPDWFFSAGDQYAEQGWIAVAVEYRVADRHDNLLPQAISDGKSLIGFLRKNAEEFQIDPKKIMATGDSSGATISLALATLDETQDEPTEDLSISSRPNAIMINAGLADLTGSGHQWWHQYYDPQFIKSISPLHQVKEGLPPMLIVHGTNDNSVDIEFIREYVKKSRELGNLVYFHELPGAPHMIWRIPYFSNQIQSFRKNFLKELNW